MLGKREPDPTPDPHLEPAPPSDLPIAFQGKAARLKRWPPHDRKTPRIISFGTRTIYQQGRFGRADIPIELEGGCDAADTTRTFYRYVGEEQWHENDVSDQPTTKVIETGIVVQRNAPSPNAGTGKANVVTKFPPLTPEQRAAAEVMRGIVGEVGT